jgi:hypothetical protein
MHSPTRTIIKIYKMNKMITCEGYDKAYDDCLPYDGLILSFLKWNQIEYYKAWEDYYESDIQRDKVVMLYLFMQW